MATQEELIVQFRAETDQMRREMAAMQSQLNDFVNTTRTTSQEYRRSIENMGDANSEYSQRLQQLKAEQREAMKPHIEELKQAQMAYLDAAISMETYTGSAQDLIATINEIGAAQKAANDALINNNVEAKASILETIATMNNMTPTATRLRDNLRTMGNPLYNLSHGALAAGEAIERMANRGSAAQLALEFLGPNASMKELQQQIRTINTGLMRMQMVALAAAVSSALLYGALHNANMEMNPKYAEAYTNMLEKLSEAFNPMKEAFAAVMIPVYKFVTAIAELIIKFNEAHPVLAKFIQGTMMLVPALTLILAPLAVGIGLLKGYRAALFLVWTTFKPLILGLMTVTPVAWAVAAAIAGLVVGFTYAYKNIEPFRKAVDNAVTALKGLYELVFGSQINGEKMLSSIGMSDEVIQGINKFVGKIEEAFRRMKEAIVQAFHGDFSGITELFKTIFPSLLAVIIGGIPGLVIGMGTMFARMSEATGIGGAQMITKFSEVLGNMVLALTNFVTTQLPVFLQQGVQIITGIIQGITQALPQVVSAVLQIVTTFITGLTTLLPQIITIGITLIQTLVTAIVTALPVIIQAAIQIINALVQGIAQMLPLIVQSAIQVITMFIQTIIPLIPQLIDAGIQILMAVVNGIIQILPQLIDAAIQIMTTLLNAIVQNLPLIIDAGIKILDSLINGIIQVLPQIIDAVLQIVTKFTESIVQNLPKILDSGIKILEKLIEGIIKILPQIIDAVIKIITKFTETIVQKLPEIIDAGVQILTKLIEGIIKVLPQLVSAAIKLMGELLKAIIQHLPDLLSAGVELIGALIEGIISLLGEVFSSGVEIGGELLDSLGDIDLFEIGANIIEGLIDGISSMASAAWEEAKSVASGIKDAVTGFLDIHSPSRVMRDIGIYTGQGLIKGINSMENPVYRAAKSMAESVKESFDTLSDGITLGDVSMGAVSAPAIPNISTRYTTPSNISSFSTSSGFGQRAMVTSQESQSAGIKENNSTATSNKQPAIINVQIGKQQFTSFVNDISAEQEAVKARKAVF